MIPSNPITQSSPEEGVVVVVGVSGARRGIAGKAGTTIAGGEITIRGGLVVVVAGGLGAAVVGVAGGLVVGVFGRAGAMVPLLPGVVLLPPLLPGEVVVGAGTGIVIPLGIGVPFASFDPGGIVSPGAIKIFVPSGPMT